MTPVEFPEANVRFGPPPDLTDSQCLTIFAYRGEVERGSIEGAPVVVTAWKPSPEEIDRILMGEPIYLTFIGGGLPPHYLCTDFHTATHPA